ncbi:MAG TPA: D-alanyl-D-alanine carboxypeptidase family protein, partial [Chloroflexia bacterium]|nr:D-alanyl-D-alanine carboxypeptidase family protein [Chloroflexia bacterium]
MVKGRARQHQEQSGPERAHHHDAAPSASAHESGQSGMDSVAHGTALLGDARLDGRGNGPVRAAVMQRMQQSVGNRALQRLLRSPSVTLAPATGEIALPAQPAPAGTPSVQRTPDGQIAIQKASELDTTGAEQFTTPSGKFYRFASVSSHKNSTSRPQFQHPATAMKAYSGAGSNGAALIHPAVSSALNTLMAALIAEGARLDDESMKQAVVDNGYRPSALSEGQAYLGALKKTIAQNPKIFGELTFPSSLESTATSELGFSGSSAHNAFRDEVARQPGWNANLAQQLVSITAGFKAPRGGSTHHSGLAVDINFPYAISDKSSKFHGIARENNANALRSAAGNWLNTFAPGFGFDSYDTGKEIWHMEWRDWSGTSADPKGATTPPPTPAAPSGGTGTSVQQMRASVQRRAVRQAGPGVQRGPTLSRITPVQRDDPKPGWSKTGAGSSNAGEKQVGAIRRIPIEGLDVGNKSNDMDTPVAWEKDPITEKPDKTKPKAYTLDRTKETAMKRAIVLVPDNLNTKDPIEVLLHLHGFGIGYRQPKGGGLSRDEDNDKTAAQLEAGKRNMIGVL